MKNNKGFTLVELAIVIVIIGLLVGGVLQGQELINQAKLRRLQSDTEGFKASIQIFRAKYNFLAGDMPNAFQLVLMSAGCTNTVVSDSNPNGCNGNGSGSIDGDFSGSGGVYERFRLWQSLSVSRMIKGSYSGQAGPVSYADEVPGTNIPQANGYSNVGFSFPAPFVHPADNTYFFAGTYNGYMIIAADSTAYADPYGWVYREFLNPSDTYSLDVKYDDGKPATGLIRAAPSGSNPGCTTTDVSTTAEYNVSNSRIACALRLINVY